MLFFLLNCFYRLTLVTIVDVPMGTTTRTSKETTTLLHSIITITSLSIVLMSTEFRRPLYVVRDNITVRELVTSNLKYIVRRAIQIDHIYYCTICT